MIIGRWPTGWRCCSPIARWPGAMGACGREFVRAGFSADVVRQTLRGALG